MACLQPAFTHLKGGQVPSDALLQHLPSYLGFSYLGRGVFLHGCSSKVQPLHLTLDEKSPRSHPHSQLSSSEVAAPGPGEFLRSVQKIPREGRKVAVNDLSS